MMKSLSVAAVVGVVGLCLVPAGRANAQTGEAKDLFAMGVKFEPGPIVNGHPRQPTAKEFEARMQVLREQARIRTALGRGAQPN